MTIVKVCGYCEHQFGRQHLEPGQQASHGVCKRHFIESVKAIAPPGYLDYLRSEPDDSFCPDLAKHLELVEPTHELTTDQ